MRRLSLVRVDGGSWSETEEEELDNDEFMPLNVDSREVRYRTYGMSMVLVASVGKVDESDLDLV